VSRLEVDFVIILLHAALNTFLRVLHVLGEGGDRALGWAFLAWLRRPEWFVVLHQGRRLLSGLTLGDWAVFTDHILSLVKQVRLLCLLREGLLLHE
jgi:hypothetical protein